MSIEVIGVWSGDNFSIIISTLFSRNPDLRIRKQGTKLIIKDPEIGYYSCIAIGCEIEIPKYEPRQEEDLEQEEENSFCDCAKPISSEQIELLKQWGLWVDH